MGANTNIEWATHTFNPWIGCAKVSQGCKFCYAEALMDTRWGKAKWGPHGTRTRTSDAYWKKPLAWDRQAERAVEAGEPPPRVFTASLADVFEPRDDLTRMRADLLDVIRQTPHLNWMVLTKHPDQVLRLLRAALHDALSQDSSDLAKWIDAWISGLAPTNVWVGTSVENKETLVRLEHLVSIPAAIRFVSAEPLLERIDVTPWLREYIRPHDAWRTLIHLVIIGGESGPDARPFHADWATDLIAQCRENGVCAFVKQVGSDAWYCGPECDLRIHTDDRKGGTPAEWPAHLRVREMPDALAREVRSLGLYGRISRCSSRGTFNAYNELLNL